MYDDEVNFMLSVVKGLEPRDQVEAMMAAQMAAVHMQTVAFVRKLVDAEYIDQQDSAERAFNKLARNFHDAAGGAQEVPHRRSAEGHSGARDGQPGWPGHRRQRRDRGDGWPKSLTLTPCAAHMPPRGALRRPNARVRRAAVLR